MGKRKYLVWSHVDDSWMAAPGAGFVKEVEKAGIYEEAEAMRLLDIDSYWFNKPPRMLYPAGTAKRILAMRKRKEKMSVLP